MARRNRGLQRTLQAGFAAVVVTALGVGVYVVNARDSDHPAYDPAELAAQVASGAVPSEAGELLRQFRGTTASRQVGVGAVSSIAVGGSMALVSGSSDQIAVLSMPDLKEIGRIPTTQPSAQMAARDDYNFEFVVLDGDQIELFAGAEGEVPVQVDSIRVPFAQNTPGQGFAGPGSIGSTSTMMSRPGFLAQSLFGPFVDDAGGIMVVSSDLQILYWSPVSRETFVYDLRQDPLVASMANTRVVAASGFAPTYDSELNDTVSPPTNDATGLAFMVATSQGQVFQVHLGKSDASDPSRTRTAPAWLSQWLEVGSGPGTEISSLSWSENRLLVGTDAGLKMWSPKGPRGRELPVTDLDEKIDTAVGMTHRLSSWAAVSTRSGVSLLSDEGRVDLGFTSPSFGTNARTVVLSSAVDGRLVVGHNDGMVFVTTTMSAQPSLAGSTTMEAGPDGGGQPFMAPDGASLAMLDESTVTIVDQAGAPISTIRLDGLEPSTLAWTPDGRKIAFADPVAREVGVVDVRTGELEGLPIVVPPVWAPLALLWATDAELQIGLFTGEEHEPSETLVVNLKDISWQRQLCALLPDPSGQEKDSSAPGTTVNCPDPTPATRAEHKAWTELDFAAIPSVCKLPAGDLVFGRTPWIATSLGGASLADNIGKQVPLSPQSNGTLALLNCSAGGVGWPQTLVLYGPGSKLLSHLDLSTVQYPGHTGSWEHIQVERIDVDGNEVGISLRSYEGAGYEIRTWRGRLHIAEDVMRLEHLELISGPENPYDEFS